MFSGSLSHSDNFNAYVKLKKTRTDRHNDVNELLVPLKDDTPLQLLLTVKDDISGDVSDGILLATARELVSIEIISFSVANIPARI